MHEQRDAWPASSILRVLSLGLPRAFLALVFLALGPTVVAGPLCATSDSPTPLGEAEYESWLEQRYTGPFSLEDVAEFEVDDASLRLEEGQVWLLEPASTGAVTGLVFEGTGRFEWSVPDRLELEQLRRFADREELEELDVPFRRLVLRSSDPAAVALMSDLVPADLASDGRGPAETSRLARRRHELWAAHHDHDADARVVEGLRNLGDRYLRADFETEEWGWLTFQFDRNLPEEMDLLRLAIHGTYPTLEGWLSVDQPSERLEDGRPTSEESTPVVLEHVDAEVDLTKLGRYSHQGYGQSHTIDARFQSRLRFLSRRPGVTAIHLALSPIARVQRVRASSGEELPVLRLADVYRRVEPDDRFASPHLVVLLSEPLDEGDRLDLDFDYELELVNFAAGSHWHPTVRGRHRQPLTARIRVRHRDYYSVRGMGAQIATPCDDAGAGERSTTFETQRPALHVGFSFGRYAHEKRYEEPGLPSVVLFGTTGGWLSEQKLEVDVAPHVLESLHSIHRLLDRDLPSDELVVTLIGSPHGQAFPGLIQIDDFIATKPGSGIRSWGAKRLFMAHEVAHQWWGLDVGWSSYRDAWLSEALAEYTAMLAIEADVENGERLFDDILEAYTSEVNGSFRGVFSNFARPGAVLLTKRSARRIGPIGHGYRAVTSQAPTAYSTMSYRKGSLVLHMIRRQLQIEAELAGRSERDPFVELLRELLDRYSGETLSTAKLAALLDERHASRLPGGWTQFMDQWIGAVEVPTLGFDHEWTTNDAGDLELRVLVERRDVPPDFAIEVPVRMTFPDGRQEERSILVDAERSETRWRLDELPTELELAPDHAVLARFDGDPRRDVRPSAHVFQQE